MKLGEKIEANIEAHDEEMRAHNIALVNTTLDDYEKEVIRLIKEGSTAPAIITSDCVVNVLSTSSLTFCKLSGSKWVSGTPMIEEIEQAWVDFVHFFNEEDVVVVVDDRIRANEGVRTLALEYT